MTLNPVLPNRASDATIQSYLVQRGIQYFQYKAGYCPDKLTSKNESHLELPQMSPMMIACAYSIMRHFPDVKVRRFNPRVSYFIIIWLLIGRDNPYNVLSQCPEVISIARMFLRIAIGLDTTQTLSNISYVQQQPKLMNISLEDIVQHLILDAKSVLYTLRLGNQGQTFAAAGTLFNRAIHLAWWHITTEKMPKAQSEVGQMWVRWQARQAENTAQESIQKRALQWQTLIDVDFLPFIRTCIIDLYGVSL